MCGASFGLLDKHLHKYLNDEASNKYNKIISLSERKYDCKVLKTLK